MAIIFNTINHIHNNKFSGSSTAMVIEEGYRSEVRKFIYEQELRNELVNRLLKIVAAGNGNPKILDEVKELQESNERYLLFFKQIIENDVP